MTKLNQWVLWKTVDRKGKATKVPYQVGGTEAKSNDPQTWAAFDAAWQGYEAGGYDGVGFVFSAYDPFVGVDLDGCRNPKTGEVAPWAKDVIKKLNSYAEVSPSETGVKLFMRGKSPFDTGKKRDVDQPVVVDGRTPGIEIYEQLRYFAVTGWKLAGVAADVQERETYWLRERFWQDNGKPPTKAGIVVADPSVSVVDRARRYMATMPPAVSGQGGHNQTFTVACRLVLGFGLDQGEALSLLREYSAGCLPPWTERELAHKVKSAAGQPGERNYLRDAEPATWAALKVPEYKAPRGPRSTTLQEATELYLQRVESGGDVLVSLGIPELDRALGGGVAAGEVVIIASRPSHGKSAIALQCIHSMTKDGLPAVMISEEMSAQALAKRTVQYVTDIPQEDWRHCMDGVRNHLDSHFESRAMCRIVEACGSAEAAANVIRQAVEQDGAKVAAVDYAQLLRSKGGSRYEEVTNTSITLRQVTTETGVVLLMLCQLNRAIEQRQVFHPTMADLRDSGQLEQDSDVILFLFWPHRMDPKHDPHEFFVFVGKNRNREIVQSTVKCRFLPTRQMLEGVREDGHWIEDFAERYP